jgi:plasmid stabilization system protein ParE
MKIVILPSARDDLAEGFAFYQKQQAGIGIYFLESLFSEIDSLTLYAGIHRKVFGLHRLLASRFPYAIYYAIDEQTVFVRAVLDCRRDPAQLRRQLKR